VIRRYLAREFNKLREAHELGLSGAELVRCRASLVDLVLDRLWGVLWGELVPLSRAKMSLVALGGYGRGELNPYSDLDVMLLYEERHRESAGRLAQKLYYALWDVGLDIGHSLRTVEDCMAWADRDLVVETSLLDARHLAGSVPLFQSLKAGMRARMVRESNRFIEQKLLERTLQKEKHGRTVYLLEPHVKESEGGLRDLHTGLWVAKAKFKVDSLEELVHKGLVLPQELAELDRAYDYLWRIRNGLHYWNGGKNDRLTMNAQEALAARFGFVDDSRDLAVEAFMQDYYLHARRNVALGTKLVALALGASGRFFAGRTLGREVGDGFLVYRKQLIPGHDEIFREDPVRMLKAFAYACEHQVELSDQLRELISHELHLLDGGLVDDPRTSEFFMDVCRRPGKAAAILSAMNDSGVLARVIPAFEAIYCKAQRFLYHAYTIDVHSLYAVAELDRLHTGSEGRRFPEMEDLLASLENTRPLYLGTLFHDIGKGSPGDHSLVGADIAEAALRRLGTPPEERETAVWLVRNHLLMAHLAEHRDVTEPRVINDFARTCGTIDRLKMLYLLTFADLRAVGPDVWSDWKGSLLRRLYQRTLQVLRHGGLKLVTDEKRIEEIREKVFSLGRDRFSAEYIAEQFQAMRRRYLLTVPAEKIVKHLEHTELLEKQNPVVRSEYFPEEGYTEITVGTYDRPGLLADLFGVITALHINVLDAQIHTHVNGVVMDMVHVNDAYTRGPLSPPKVRRLEKTMAAVFQGRETVDALMEKHSKPAILVRETVSLVPTRVQLDNRASDFFTVLEIFTQDRLGLLYALTREFSALGLNIYIALISTKVDQAADVFYLTDLNGNKVQLPEHKEKVITRIHQVLEELNTQKVNT